MLETDTQIIWWVTLGIGLVVAIVVVTLLQMLLSTVNRIDTNVAVLWQTATTVARNTATSWQLGETAETLDEVQAEALRHDALLSGATPSTEPPATNGGPQS